MCRFLLLLCMQLTNFKAEYFFADLAKRLAVILGTVIGSVVTLIIVVTVVWCINKNKTDDKVYVRESGRSIELVCSPNYYCTSLCDFMQTYLRTEESAPAIKNLKVTNIIHKAGIAISFTLYYVANSKSHVALMFYETGYTHARL